ncbi:MAG: UDP-N-acetylmuramate dehydrogenase [Eubacterium sp.]|nr:UDP-N-acetylmuramate dehydrogenase [Eubacterium sp.]
MIEKLRQIVGEDSVKENENMANHTTFKCGGNASIYVAPNSIDELLKVLEVLGAEEYPYMVIGNGSNLLVKDSGYKGAIVEVDKKISEIDVRGEEIVVEAGAKLSKVATIAMENDLAGFEFAHGIPGNMGGAVVMNAGAYGGEMKDVLKWVKVVDQNGEIKTLENDELELGYRTSLVMKEKMIVLEACIKLELGIMGEVADVMALLMSKRKASQPLEYPSAGSTFKRPEGYYAGKLVQDAGMKGYRVGDAMVSDKHSGFVINCGNATATEVIQVIKDVQAKVKEEFGVDLETEVRIIG